MEGKNFRAPNKSRGIEWHLQAEFSIGQKIWGSSYLPTTQTWIDLSLTSERGTIVKNSTEGVTSRIE